jgi:hypothetical protein
MTPKQIRKKLEQQGETYRSFAKKFGFQEKHVSLAVKRWAGKEHGFPGGNTYKICITLSHVIGTPISPVLSFKPTKRKPKA